MPRTTAFVLLLAGVLCGAEFAVQGGPVGSPDVHLFVRSCAECLDGTFCEFGHPDATPDLPLACIAPARDGRALYRRYDAAADNCLERPGLMGKYYGVGSFGCISFHGTAGNLQYGVGGGACPQDPWVLNATIAPGPSTPGSCIDIDPSNSIAFGPNCNSLLLYDDDTCATLNDVAHITEPFA
ncbi:hypothetical protein DFJ74DRAFT_702913 [Hyaloraphidium curvatum]|nr:hypothetical protein DFJ74DRAFT_702913 [Hyaloraphidium curvatum]